MNIETPSDFGRALKAGPFAWPGGYPVYFVCADGEPLSFADAKAHAALICSAIRDQNRSGWRVIGADINWDDNCLFSAHSGEKIQAAYV
jgi:hypothetical protein